MPVIVLEMALKIAYDECQGWKWCSWKRTGPRRSVVGARGCM